MKHYKKITLSILLVLSFVASAGNDKIKVACIGDSITYGFRLKDPKQEAFPSQLQKMLGEKYKVRNFGVPGLGIYRHLPWKYSKNGKRAWSLSPQYTQALKWNPDIIVSALGANDVAELPKEFTVGTNGLSVLERGTFKNQYIDLLKSFKSNGASPRILMWTSLGAMKEKYTANYGMALSAIASDLKTVAAEIGAEEIDMYSITKDSAQNEPWPDQIHPSASTHIVIAKAIFSAITRNDDVNNIPEVGDGRFTWGARDEHLAVVNNVLTSPEETTNILSLRGEWEFSAKPMHRAPFRNGVWEHYYKMKWQDARSIQVPSCWEAQGVGEEGMSEYWNAVWDNGKKPIRHKHMGDGWYRKTVKIPSSWSGKRIWLKIGGVKSKGWFWVNEKQVALVDNYCGTYKYEITDLVKPGDEAIVAAQVNNILPSRKGLMSIIHKWGGLYRDIELEATPQTFIDDAYVRGLFDEKSAEVHIAVENAKTAKQETQIRITIDNECVSKTLAKSRNQIIKLPLTKFRPWSPDHPNLYTARVDLVENGSVIHSRLERFGVRKFEVRGKEFYLNDKVFYVRGFGDDFVYPISGMTPPDREFHKANLLKAKAAGFNFVRLHTHCEIPEYFEAADEVGIMIQAELPYYSDVQTEGAEFDPKRDATELWRHYRRYPSFTVYSMGNEGSFGAKLDAQLHAYIKAMDPDRLKINQDCHVEKINPPEASDYLGGPIREWKIGSFNPDRPFVTHEYLNLCIKLDSRDEAMYSGVWMPPVTREKREKWLKDRGLSMKWGDALQDAQNALQRHYQKQGVEMARRDPYCDGYCFWTIVDVVVEQGDTYTAQGLFNPFWLPKRGGFTIEEFAKFNSPSCVLLNVPDKNYVYKSGDTINASFLFAHYGNAPISNAKLEWKLEAENKVLASNKKDLGEIVIGPVKEVSAENILVPDIKKPVHAVLTASINGIENSWDFWLFPKREKRDARNLAVAPSLAESIGKLYKDFALLGTDAAKNARVVVVEGGTPEAEKAIKEGKKVIALGKAEGVPNVSLGWWWIRTQTGTALRKHSIFGDLPHKGVLSPLLFRIVGKGSPLKDSGRSEEDLFMVGEGGEDCYTYLARRTHGNAIVYESFGLDLLSGTPEGTTILDGMIDDLLKQ
jgi:lysophospholipase L1-like esterase